MSDLQGDALRTEIDIAHRELITAAALIKIGKDNLGPAEWDDDAISERANAINEEIDEYGGDDDEMRKLLITLKGYLEKALPILIKYSENPDASHVGLNYGFRLHQELIASTRS